jgi:hypothetical protein
MCGNTDGVVDAWQRTRAICADGAGTDARMTRLKEAVDELLAEIQGEEQPPRKPPRRRFIL